MESTATPTPKEFSERAMQQYKEEEFNQAATLFEQAAEAYQQAGDSLMAAEERNNQSVAYLRAGQPRAALQASRGTEIVFANAGDPVRQAKALGNQAAALEAMKSPNEAVETYLRAADLFKTAGEFELYTLLMKTISSIRMRQGKFVDSLMTMRLALSEKTRLTLREKIIKSLSDFAFKLFTRNPTS